MAWVWLGAAALCEVAWAVLLKASVDGKRSVVFALSVVLMLASFGLLAQAMKTLPVGTAYAVWTGIGAVGATLFGIVAFGESASPLRLAFLALIVVGVVGLSASEPASKSDQQTPQTVNPAE